MTDKPMPYPNPSCSEHNNEAYLWNGDWWYCPKGDHLKQKFYILVRDVESSEHSSEWSYGWELEESEYTSKDIALRVPEEIYKTIIQYERT